MFLGLSSTALFWAMEVVDSARQHHGEGDTVN
jgi:hypothetical protein